MARKLLLLNVAALSPWEIDDQSPNLAALANTGRMNPLIAPEPALTCSSHATMITGSTPREHGIVANGWYEEPHGKIFNWGRSDKLITGERIWDAAKAKAANAERRALQAVNKVAEAQRAFFMAVRLHSRRLDAIERAETSTPPKPCHGK